MQIKVDISPCDCQSLAEILTQPCEELKGVEEHRVSVRPKATWISVIDDDKQNASVDVKGSE